MPVLIGSQTGEVSMWSFSFLPVEASTVDYCTVHTATPFSSASTTVLVVRGQADVELYAGLYVLYRTKTRLFFRMGL